jgi:small redox-active disulfide protein 2
MPKIQILGTGCGKCHRLFENAQQAANESGISCDIVKVAEIIEILAFNPIHLPALAIDGHVKVSGRVPSPDEIKSLLATAK